jgi:UDP-3-O-[3-hydroxymyristoyl] glucosamine N-acyltransferase
VGVAGHLTIGKPTRVAAQSGIGKNLDSGEIYFGRPALPRDEAFLLLKQIIRFPELADRARRLEAHLVEEER